MTIKEFVEECLLNLHIKVTKEELEKLAIYTSFLKEYNEHTNLTAIKEDKDIYLKHYYDSLTMIRIIDLSKEETLLDIGTGAGFPGVVLKIFYPNLKVILLDSNHKKTDFLKELVSKLDLDNVTIVNARVEDFAKDNLNSFDVVTARAVTNMRVLTELAMPLVKKDKYFVAMKGSNDDEIFEAEQTIYKYGIVEDMVMLLLPHNAGTRTLIRIKKNDNTLAKDLRSYIEILKNI